MIYVDIYSALSGHAMVATAAPAMKGPNKDSNPRILSWVAQWALGSRSNQLSHSKPSFLILPPCVARQTPSRAEGRGEPFTALPSAKYVADLGYPICQEAFKGTSSSVAGNLLFIILYVNNINESKDRNGRQQQKTTTTTQLQLQ